MHEAPTAEFTGHVVIVAGGAGEAGGCVVDSLLRAGATVVVPSRSPSRLDALRGRVPVDAPGRLYTAVGDLSDRSSRHEIRGRVRSEVGPVDAVVASLGGWWEGEPLVDVPLHRWNQILTDNLTSHFLTARTFLPDLVGRPNPVYVMLAGIAALDAIPGSGPISVTGAAQTMLLRTLAAEYAATSVRFHELAILTPIATAANDAIPETERWISRAELGAAVTAVLGPSFPDRDRLLLRVPAGWKAAPDR